MRNNHYVFPVTMFLFFLFAWWTFTYNIDLKIAWSGFSPIGWVYRTFDPAAFSGNFHNGEEDFSKSAFMHIYLYAYKCFNITPEILLPLIVGVEIAVLAWAVYALCRVLIPDSSRTVIFLVIALFIASNARDMNIARFKQPFFIGQYYNIADALRIFAIVMFLKGRSIWAGVLLAGSFASHLTMGLMGGIFIMAAQMPNIRDTFRFRTLLGAAAFVAIAALWMAYIYEPEGIVSSNMPEQMWFNLARLFNFHWYPVEYGLFTLRHEERFVQFVSFILLLIFYIGRGNQLRQIDKKIIAGFIAMAVLVAAGIVISSTKPSPTLVKLALHRANDLIIIVGLVYVVNGLWSEFELDGIWRKIIAAGILVSPFVLEPGYPLLFSIILTAPAWLDVLRRNPVSFRCKLVAASAMGIIIIILAYVATGMAGKWTSKAYTGGGFFLISVVISWGILTLLPFLMKRWSPKELAKAFASVVCIFLTIFWLQNYRAHILGKEALKMSGDYKQVQLWAKNNTTRDALFMVDPSINYGWRDYSQRSSFGSLREWLHTSWLYNSKLEFYLEGMKRFNEFKISLDGYLGVPHPLSSGKKLGKDVKRQYYSFNDDWRLDIAKRYGIDYFVMKKNEMKTSSQMLTAYENEHFIVLSVSPAN